MRSLSPRLWVAAGISVGLLILSTTISAATPAAHHPIGSPIGVYPGTVTRPGATDHITLTFTATGQSCLRTSDGLSTGTWSQSGSQTFTFRIKEALIVNGQQTGWVYINQNANLNGNSFTSSGVSDLTDLNGNPIGTSPAQITATLNDSARYC